MNIGALRDWATDKARFLSVKDFLDFGQAFLEYRDGSNLQAELVSRNTPQYRFFQYREEADFQLTRPINTDLFYTADEFGSASSLFYEALESALDAPSAGASQSHRESLNRVIYTAQQAIGAALDSLPAGRSNAARKINGERFERFIGLAINHCGIECRSGVLRIPVKDEQDVELFKMNYQHDLMLEVEGELRAIGSVKTSSKDRIDKVFIDKFLYNRLTGIPTPHFAIFLNDVQRKGREPNFGTSQTFLRGHFKGYTVKLNSLDGVYYCDLLPQMETDPLLAENIDRIDRFFIDDLPAFVRHAPGPDVEISGGIFPENSSSGRADSLPSAPGGGRLL